MTRDLRRAHRLMFLLLAALLPVVLALGLACRPDAPLSSASEIQGTRQ